VLNLKSVIVEVNSKKIIDENAKKDMERAINLLHKEYDDFTKNNSEAIANLQSIESLSRN
jgi:hypothetical protein